MIHIVHSSARQGGIKTVSTILNEGFIENGHESTLFNMNDYGNSFFATVKNSFKELKKYNTNDIFILQHIDPIVLGFLLLLKKYKNIVNVIHTDIVRYYKISRIQKRFFLSLLFFILRNKQFVFVSKEAELKARSFFKLKKTKTIYNVYEFKEKKFAQNLGEKIVLGFISRFHSLKNIDLAIRVIKALYEQGTAVSLKIYGSGPEEASLKEYVKEMNCEDYIIFMGESDKIKEIYKSFDALISFSVLEGLPTVILESINYAKPVFHTDCTSGPRELMAPSSNPLEKTDSYEKTDTGYLVKPVTELRPYAKELNVYEKEYISFLSNFIEDIRQNRFSMQFDAKPFSHETIMGKWLKLIKDLQK